jgi:hypothetical protein
MIQIMCDIQIIDGNTFSEKSWTTNAPVFFKKDGEDQVGIPNWFTYWKEDGACPRLKIPNLSLYYKRTYGEYDPDKDHIYISPFSSILHDNYTINMFFI